MKPQHISICNELRKLISSGRITQIKIISVEGKEVVCYKLNQKDKTFSKGEKGE